LGQLGQGVLCVQWVQVDSQVGTGLANPRDILQCLAADGWIEGSATPRYISLARLHANKHHWNTINLDGGSYGMRWLQRQFGRYDLDLRDLHKYLPSLETPKSVVITKSDATPSRGVVLPSASRFAIVATATRSGSDLHEAVSHDEMQLAAK
jgi:hypothetical protein